MAQSRKALFEKDGFIVVEGLFSHEEVSELKDEKDRVLAEVVRQKGEQAIKHGVHVGMTAASSKFKEAAAKPELVAALKEVIGDEVVFLSDKVVFKDANVDFGSPWHQDYPYWQGSHKYSVWIALDDARPENGCLRVVPGSHSRGFVQHGDATDGNGFSNRLTADSIDPAQIMDLPAERGTAIIFHDLLFHASYSNQTGAERVALISTYKDGTKEDPDYPWAVAAFKL